MDDADVIIDLTDSTDFCSNKKTVTLIKDLIENEQERKEARAKLIITVICIEMKMNPDSINETTRFFANLTGEKNVLQDVTMKPEHVEDLATIISHDLLRKKLYSDSNNYKMFSICIDESVDVYQNNVLLIVVKYPDFDLKCIKTVFWEVVPIEKSNNARNTSQQLLESIKASFGKCDIPITNIYSCFADKSISIVDKENGLHSLLSKEIPGIIVLQSIDHFTHKCIHHAMSQYPSFFIVDFIENCSTMLKNSSNDIFNELQKEFAQVSNKFFGKTAWLSLETLIVKILDQWSDIFTYAQQHQHECRSANRIFTLIMQNGARLYFLVLQKVFNELNNLNNFLKRQDVIIHLVKREIEKTYKNIVSIILNSSYVMKTAAPVINLIDENNYLRFCEFLISPDVTNELLVNGSRLKDFCVTTFNFIFALSLQMKKYFNNFHYPLYEAVECLNPQNALSLSFRKSKPRIMEDLLRECGGIIGSSEELALEIIKQWNLLQSLIGSIKIENDVVDFWMNIREIQNEFGEAILGDLSEFVIHVLAISHSHKNSETVCVEEHTVKNRNLPRIEVIKPEMRIRKTMKNLKPNSFKPSEEMITKAIKAKYDEKKN